MFKKLSKLLRRRALPLQFPTSGYPAWPDDQKLEEETLPYYETDASDYYHAHLGQVLQDRYQLVSKLGYGTTSTVWLCKDLHQHSYLTAKICNLGAASDHNPEIEVSRRIAAMKLGLKRDIGRAFVRAADEHFRVPSTMHNGEHLCMLFDAYGPSLAEVKKSFKPLPVLLVKAFLTPILRGLNFLHNRAKMTHCDLNPGNILCGIGNPLLLANFEEAEMEEPFSRKQDHLGRTIYQSRTFHFTKGLPAISDMGQVRFGDGPHTGLIQPYHYRAPEVILDMPWSYEVDIWNLGMMVWHLVEGTWLVCDGGARSEAEHLAAIVGLLGPPPSTFVERGGRSSEFFDPAGKWLGGIEVNATTLESASTRFDVKDSEQVKEKAMFLNMMRKMLQWEPTARATAADLLDDEWVRSVDNE